MKILYIKTISAVIFILVILFPAIYLWFGFLYKKSDGDINQFLSEGSLNYIENVLDKSPQDNWQTILNNLSPKNSVATILAIDKLPLNKQQKSQLLQGKTIYINGANYLFLYYGTERTFVYKRIGNTQYAVKLPLGESVYTLVHSSIEWMINIIDLELSQHAQKNWPLVLPRLEKQFDIGLKLHLSVPENIKNQLKTHQIAFAHKAGTDNISTIYASLKKSNAILQMGPFDRMPATKQFSVFQHYYFWIFSIITVLIVFFLTKIFSRNVKKIDELTTHFSRGEFESYTTISRFSVLKGIHTNVVSMGNKINALIKSQNNMTRFVAHEIRTPLSTMQFALDSIKKENNLSKNSQKNLMSIQEDIQAINKLISYFLLYYKTTSHELKCKMEILNITAWLEIIVKKYDLSKIKVAFISSNNIDYSFDPQLLKNAIDNLITNALKFAQSNVIVSLKSNKNNIEISVDDDGPGIPESEIKNIFEPFSVLSETQEFGKHIGLGLTIAKSIVTLHKGIIVVSRSVQLGGAKFTIILPR
jgi:two-component system sensor histidine kinase RstB